MALLKIGDTAPDFSLPDQYGRLVSLRDYAEQNILIWFFPRAFGGG